MEFKSFNFKLAVINELIALGLLDEQLAPVYEKQEKGYYEKHYEQLQNRSSAFDDEWDDDFDDDLFDGDAEEYYYSHPEMEEEIDALELSPELLAKVEKLDLDYGEVQGMLSPYWHGEDELFLITHISDIVLLPALKHVEFSFALDSEIKDLSPLLELPVLEKVTTVSTLDPSYFFSHDKETRRRLEEKGVKVRRGK